MIKQDLIFQMKRNEEIKIKRQECGKKDGRPKQNNKEKPNGFERNQKNL